MRSAAVPACMVALAAAPPMAAQHSSDTINAIHARRRAPAHNSHRAVPPRSTPRHVAAHRSATPPRPAAPRLIVANLGGGRFTTIGAAVRAAASQPGAIVLVRAGTYSENVVIDRPVQIAADPNSPTAPVIDGGSAPAITLRADQAVVKGLALRAADAECALEVRSGHATVEDCDIGRARSASAGIRGATAAPTLRYCRMHDAAAEGLLAIGGAHVVLDDCNITQSGVQGLVADSASVTMSGGSVTGAAQNGVFVTNGGSADLYHVAVAKSGYSGIWVNHASKIALHTCAVSDCAAFHGIALADGSAATIVGGEVSACAQNGIAAWASALSVTDTRVHECATGIMFAGSHGIADGCDVRDTHGSGIIVSQGGDPTVRACHVRDAGWDCIQLNDNARGQYQDCDLSGAANCLMSMNHSDPTVQHCRLHDGKRIGIWALFPGHGTVDDCDILDVAGNGIEVSDGANPYFHNCRIRGSKESGIYVRARAHATLDNCEVTGSSKSGLAVDQADAELVGCRITGNAGAGIWMTGGSTAAARGCTVWPNALGATHVDSGCKIAMSGTAPPGK